MNALDEIQSKFAIAPPLFLSGGDDMVKLEMKPYLQPFERILAHKELQSILGKGADIAEQHGYFLVRTSVSEKVLIEKLTYWQRVGRNFLIPTLQKSLEFTQYGSKNYNQKPELHNVRRLRYGPHDIHEYRGKFFPQLVKSLINISGVGKDAIVLDPMCGSGTTLCETVASGRYGIGADLNPLSILISTVKAQIVLEQPQEFKRNITSELLKFNHKAEAIHPIWSESDLKYLKLWFSSGAIHDLARIIAIVESIENIVYKNFFTVCLSNIIRSVSFQKETDLRVRKELKNYVKGEAFEKFKAEVSKQIEKIYSYLCVLSLRKPDAAFSVRKGNSVKISELFPDYIGKVDLLITSPPYATALPYLDTDRLSLICLNLLSHADLKRTEHQMIGSREVSEKQRKAEWENYLLRKSELPDSVATLIDFIAGKNHSDAVGFRRRNLPALLGKYFLEISDAMKSALRLMKPDSSAFYVVGNNSTTVEGKKVDIPTDRFLFEIGEKVGWKKIEFIPMELLASRDIFRENRGSSEAILHFKS